MSRIYQSVLVKLTITKSHNAQAYYNLVQLLHKYLVMKLSLFSGQLTWFDEGAKWGLDTNKELLAFLLDSTTGAPLGAHLVTSRASWV